MHAAINQVFIKGVKFKGFGFGADGYSSYKISNRTFLGYEHSNGPPVVFGVGDRIKDIIRLGASSLHN